MLAGMSTSLPELKHVRPETPSSAAGKTLPVVLKKRRKKSDAFDYLLLLPDGRRWWFTESEVE